MSLGAARCLVFGVVAAAVLATAPHPAHAADAAPAPPYTTELEPAYARWVPQPGEMLGFWMGPPAEMAQRTSATAFSRHESLSIAKSFDGSGRPGLHPAHGGARAWVRFAFDVAKPFRELRVFVTTAFDGAAGTAQLARVAGQDATAVEGAVRQANARQDPWMLVTPKTPQPAGRYRLEVKPAQGAVDVWPEHLEGHGASVEDPCGVVKGKDVGLHVEVVYEDGTREAWHDEHAEPVHIPLGQPENTAGPQGPMAFSQGVGEHNNPFFIRYPKWFMEAHPQAFMRAADGKEIGVNNPVLGGTNPVPAFDDPTVVGLSLDLIRTRVQQARGDKQLRYWVIGGEQAYPDIFGLPSGDFRPASIEHYKRYLAEGGETRATTSTALLDRQSGADWAAWRAFREATAAERSARYMQEFLAGDTTRPVLYPTHGNIFFAPARRDMGHAPNVIAGTCDGFETGQIVIGEDDEAFNLLTLAHLSAFGMPVMTPRLANKTIDPKAQGGGRSFTPRMARRLVYECLGMGLGHIGMVQWEGDLPDGLWHIKDTPAEAEFKTVFGEIRRGAPVLAGMGRMQPRIGLYVSDATWLLEDWDAAWTGFFQDALKAGWNVSIVNDALLGAELAGRIEALVSVNNGTLSRAAAQGMEAYLGAGGRLYQVGTLGERDERLTATGLGAQIRQTHADRVAALGGVFKNENRTLVNQASTASGVYAQTRTYHPVDLAAIETRIRKDLPESVLSPVWMRSEQAQVAAMPLTDGYGVVLVLINHASTETKTSLGLRDTAKDTVLACRDLVAGTDCQRDASSGGFSVSLAPLGTALVWLHAPCTAQDAERSVARATAAITAWTNLGADIASLAPRAEQARAALKAALPAKARALADSIATALAMKVEYSQGPSGLALRAQVWDSEGQDVSDAIVEARIVPGVFHWQALPSQGKGTYAAKDVAPPRWYDVTTGAYVPLKGSARLVFRVSRAGHRGGGMLAVIVR